MSIQLTDSLRMNLSWLASNWKDKQLQDISSFHQEFGAALRAVLGESPGQDAIELVIAGTLGKAADGYAHLLVVEPERVARDLAWPSMASGVGSPAFHIVVWTPWSMGVLKTYVFASCLQSKLLQTHDPTLTLIGLPSLS